MRGRLQISVLGELMVALDGKPVPLPASKKTRALLAYLAVVARPLRRDHLCELLWEAPDKVRIRVPMRSTGPPAMEYMVDATQRSVLFWVVMRRRGNQYRERPRPLRTCSRLRGRAPHRRQDT
jgi:hypothetical protein